MENRSYIDRIEDTLAYLIAGGYKAFLKLRRSIRRWVRKAKADAEDLIVDVVSRFILWVRRLRTDPLELILTIGFIVSLAFFAWGVASWADVIIKNDPINGSEPKAVWNMFVLFSDFVEAIRN